MNTTIESELRRFIHKNILFADDDSTLANDTPLLASGIIDSIGIMELVDFVSDHFDLDIPMKDIHQDHFDSIHRLASYIRRRRGEASLSHASPHPAGAVEANP